MTYIMTLFGLVIAVILFIYTIQFLEKGKKTLTRLHEPVTVPSSPNRGGADQKESGIHHVVRRNSALGSLSDEEKNHIPKRICPLCATELTRDEPLYAGNTLANGNRTILIYGCQYCYRRDDDSQDSNAAKS